MTEVMIIVFIYIYDHYLFNFFFKIENQSFAIAMQVVFVHGLGKKISI